MNYPGLSLASSNVDSVKDTEPAHVLLRLLSIESNQGSIIPELKNALVYKDFNLGEPIACRAQQHADPQAMPPLSLPQTSAPEHLGLNLYVIAAGQVRLLCQNAVRGKEVTVGRLGPDDMFGGDRSLTEHPLAYRAIAASPLRVVVVPGATLEILLKKYPDFNQHLITQAKHRERIIFFRQSTALQSLPSHQLKRWVPYLQEVDLPPGSVVEALHSASATDPSLTSIGRLWLREGTIQIAATSESIVATGHSWGYPQALSPDWNATTSIRLYHLPLDHWALSQVLIPPLTQLVGEPDTHGMDSSSANTSRQTHMTSPIATLNGSADGAANGATNGAANGQGPSDRYAQLYRRRIENQALVHPHPNTVLAPGALSRSLSGSEPPDAMPDSPSESDNPVIFPKPLQRHLFDALHRFPWIEQQSSSDCGAACLAMIARYWGKTIPIYTIRDAANVNRSGASLSSLATTAERFGFNSNPVRASLGKLIGQPNPWIAHWDGEHYVVVYRSTANRIIIADPAVGIHWLTREQFMQHWTGYALLLDPTTRLNDIEIKGRSMGRYVEALWPHRMILAQIILVSLLIQGFNLISPLFTQIILDRVVVQKSLTTLNVFAAGLLLFGLWGIVMSAVRQYLLSYVSNRFDLTLISGFIRHTMALPLKFFESRRVGDIITRVQENQKIQKFLVDRMVLAWLDVVTGVVYLGLMAYYNWKLTILILGLIPPIIILALIATPFLRRITRHIFKKAADQNSSLVELISGVEAVKSAAVEQDVRWRWEEKLTKQLNAQFKGAKLGIGLESANGVVQTLGSTALLWFGATMVIQDELSIGQFVAFNMMMGYVISPIVSLANLWDEFQEVTVAVERLNDVFEAHPEESMAAPMLILPPLTGHVVLDNVTFCYDQESDRNTLQNIDLTVAPGTTVAIVGRSGSGKSTLIKLLQGLYHPNVGRIIIDGHDIRHVSPQSLRKQIGVVPQDCFMFSGTIMENITLYQPDCSLAQVMDAAKLADAHGFIQALPLGYNTKVGERGSTLSGGQRQRIAIARALLGSPRILILDEATSSLDTESERRFQRNLKQLSQNRTTFIIAHRLSTVRDVEQIIVLDRGIIVEQGTHPELMQQQNLYYHLAQQQLNL